MQDHQTTIWNGLLGIFGSVVAFISSKMMDVAALVHDLTAWMQLFSFIAGSVVSILMAVKITLDIFRKRK